VKHNTGATEAQQTASQMLKTKPRGWPDIEKFTACLSMVPGPVRRAGSVHVPRPVHVPGPVNVPRLVNVPQL
jgi:hypothetical protein